MFCESFMEFHKLFEAQYTELEASIDEVAERISKLGGKSIGTMKEFADLTIIKSRLITTQLKKRW
jgi:starvation-inducible DNA-binding protein